MHYLCLTCELSLNVGEKIFIWKLMEALWMQIIRYYFHNLNISPVGWASVSTNLTVVGVYKFFGGYGFYSWIHTQAPCHKKVIDIKTWEVEVKWLLTLLFTEVVMPDLLPSGHCQPHLILLFLFIISLDYIIWSSSCNQVKKQYCLRTDLAMGNKTAVSMKQSNLGKIISNSTIDFFTFEDLLL